MTMEFELDVSSLNGLVESCVKNGLSDAESESLFKLAHVTETCLKDPEFVAGFKVAAHVRGETLSVNDVFNFLHSKDMEKIANPFDKMKSWYDSAPKPSGDAFKGLEAAKEAIPGTVTDATQDFQKYLGKQVAGAGGSLDISGGGPTVTDATQDFKDFKDKQPRDANGRIDITGGKVIDPQGNIIKGGAIFYSKDMEKAALQNIPEQDIPEVDTESLPTYQGIPEQNIPEVGTESLTPFLNNPEQDIPVVETESINDPQIYNRGPNTSGYIDPSNYYDKAPLGDTQLPAPLPGDKEVPAGTDVPPAGTDVPPAGTDQGAWDKMKAWYNKSDENKHLGDMLMGGAFGLGIGGLAGLFTGNTGAGALLGAGIGAVGAGAYSSGMFDKQDAETPPDNTAARDTSEENTKPKTKVQGADPGIGGTKTDSTVTNGSTEDKLDKLTKAKSPTNTTDQGENPDLTKKTDKLNEEAKENQTAAQNAGTPDEDIPVIKVGE